MNKKTKSQDYLSRINAELIIKKDKSVSKEETDLDNFFLTLAVIYNDLKDLFTFQEMVSEKYQGIAKETTSIPSGEFSGMTVHINKLAIGYVREFFQFLEVNKSIATSPELISIIERIGSKTVSDEWYELIRMSTNKQKGAGQNNFLNRLIQMRSNICFHYNQSGKVLRNSFQNFFFKREQIEKNKYAYYALGDTMKQTRFFYADASVEEYIRTNLVGSDKKLETVHSEELISTIKKMNGAILELMRSYLELKKL